MFLNDGGLLQKCYSSARKIFMMNNMQRNLVICLIVLSCFLMGFTWGDIVARNTKKGNEFFEAGQYDKALEAFTEADVNSQPDDPRLPGLYGNMGNTLSKQGKYARAVEMYQKALEASDNKNFKADVHYNSGNAWLKQGQYQQALQAYQQALELNPQHQQARQNKAMVEKLIVQPPPQQQQQQQQQQEQDEQQEQQEQQQQNQQEQEQQKDEQNEQQKNQQEQQQEEQQQAAQTQEQTLEEQEQQLSQEEALRILDALKEKEQLQQQQIQSVPRPVEKDW